MLCGPCLLGLALGGLEPRLGSPRLRFGVINPSPSLGLEAMRSWHVALVQWFTTNRVIYVIKQPITAKMRGCRSVTKSTLTYRPETRPRPRPKPRPRPIRFCHLITLDSRLMSHYHIFPKQAIARRGSDLFCIESLLAKYESLSVCIGDTHV